MSETNSSSKFWITFLAALGGFAIFVLILVVAYLPTAPAPVPEGTRTPTERKALLAELKAGEKSQATTYGWVDQAKGVVRLPVDRAAELTIAEINAKR